MSQERTRSKGRDKGDRSKVKEKGLKSKVKGQRSKVNFRVKGK
jgi:hypothetical protein